MRNRPALLCLCLAVVGCAAPPPPTSAPSRAAARSPAASPGAPSEASEAADTINEQGDIELVTAPGLADAFDRYRRGDLEGAAAGFYAAREAASSRPKAELYAAQFFLGKALFLRGFHVASLGSFESISREPAHPFFRRSLLWLTRLADALPDDEPALKAIGRYAPQDVGRDVPAQPEALLDSARYYIGRAYYNRGDSARAVAALRAVPEGGRWTVHARFFEGVSHVRADDSDAALRAFRTAALTADGAVAAGVPGPEALRLRDLAWLSLARVYYSTAQVSEPGEESFAAADLLKLAVEAYDHVSEAGGYRDDALLERAWAALRQSDTARALASLDALSAPFVERTPEAHYLRGLVYFSRCELDAASKAIAAFSRDYGAASSGEVERLGRDPGGAAVHDGGEPGQGVSQRLRAVIKSALAQRDTQRRFELIAMVKAEKELLTRAPSTFRSSPLGARVAQDLDRASSAASDQITSIVRARCERFARESREELDKAARISTEIEAIRGGASKCSPQRPSN